MVQARQYKVFAKVILNRITKILDENQPKEQAGFRSGYSTLDHIFTVKQVFERCKEYNIPFYCCFVDYSKAFDCLEHNKIWQALIKQGVEQKYVRIIRNIYKNSRARVKLETEGESIKIQRGVRQGDPLSPKLFTAVLEEIFRQLNWENYGLNINGENLSHLRFADDIILFSAEKGDLQRMLSELDNESRKVGLVMNVEKTRVMTNSVQHRVIVNDRIIEYTNEYNYLGQIISPFDIMGKEIETRTANAWKTYWGYKEIMKNKDTNMFFKRKLFDTCILPVLTYGCQTWALTKAHSQKLEISQRAMERSMMGKKRIDRIKNKTLRKRTKIKDATVCVKKLKWRWIGHTIRGTDKWSRRVMYWYPTYMKRSRGRQHKRWEDEVKETAGSTWSRRTWDRDEWRKLGEAFAEKRQTDTVVDVDF